jgi:type IV pilus assembly protein PilA
MRTQQPGFTLMEVVVAVAIVALLAAMALPSMTNSIVRKQIVDAVPLADLAKNAVALSWSVTQTLPADNDKAGLPVPEKIVNNYISAVTVDNGAVNITFGNSVNSTIAGKILTFRPAVEPDTPVVPVAWVCAGADVPGGMTVMGDDKTNIPLALLPFNCKGSGK